jgi:hypothetical protein
MKRRRRIVLVSSPVRSCFSHLNGIDQQVTLRLKRLPTEFRLALQAKAR